MLDHKGEERRGVTSYGEGLNARPSVGEGDRTLLGLGLRLIEGIKENCNGDIQYRRKRMWGYVPPDSPETPSYFIGCINMTLQDLGQPMLNPLFLY